MDGLQLTFLIVFFLTAVLHRNKTWCVLPVIMFTGFMVSVLIWNMLPGEYWLIQYGLNIGLDLLCVYAVGQVAFTSWRTHAIQGCFAVSIFMNAGVVVEFMLLDSVWIFEHQLWPVVLANALMILCVFDTSSFDQRLVAVKGQKKPTPNAHLMEAIPS